MGDYTNIINTAVEEAEIRGRAIGREEGRAEGRAEIVRQMFSKGMSAESISELLDISIDEVKGIL